MTNPVDGESRVFTSAPRERWLQRAENLASPLAILTIVLAVPLGLPDSLEIWKAMGTAVLLLLGFAILSDVTIRRRRFRTQVKLDGDQPIVRRSGAMEPLPNEDLLEVIIERSRSGRRKHFHFYFERGQYCSLYSPRDGQQLEEHLVRLGKKNGVKVRVRRRWITMSNWWPLVEYGLTCTAGMAIGWFAFG